MRRRKLTPGTRRAIKESADFRRRCREAAERNIGSVLEEPIKRSFGGIYVGFGRAAKASIWWRYYRRYGRAP